LREAHPALEARAGGVAEERERIRLRTSVGVILVGDLVRVAEPREHAIEEVRSRDHHDATSGGAPVERVAGERCPAALAARLRGGAQCVKLGVAMIAPSRSARTSSRLATARALAPNCRARAWPRATTGSTIATSCTLGSARAAGRWADAAIFPAPTIARRKG